MHTFNIKNEKTQRKISIPPCPCCGLAATSRRLVVIVETLQTAFPDLSVTSATRCERHNASPGVNGSPVSGHLPVWGEQETESVAVDLTIEKWTNRRARALAFAAIRAGAKGIGLYPWGLHLDLKPRFQLWKEKGRSIEYFF